jgi:periplasmic protein TonB
MQYYCKSNFIAQNIMFNLNLETMKENEKLTLTDMVFEHRNREYGAFELRKSYNQNILRAVLIGISLFLAALFSPMLFAKITPKEKDGIIVDLTPKNIVPEKQPEKVPPVEPPKEIEQVKTIQSLPPLPVPDEKIIEDLPIPKQDDLEGHAISNVTHEEGVETDNISPPEKPSSESVIADIIVDDTPFINVEMQPSFVGGMAEFAHFLQKNLKYPPAAQRANVQGRVFLSFIVEKDGRITAVESIKGIGFGCDEEAARVVKMMPKWNPGKQQGNPVRVKFTLPVVFKLDE